MNVLLTLVNKLTYLLNTCGDFQYIVLCKTTLLFLMKHKCASCPKSITK